MNILKKQFVIIVLSLSIGLFSPLNLMAKEKQVKPKKPQHLWYGFNIPPAGKGTIVYGVELTTPKNNKDQALYQNYKYQKKRAKLKEKGKEIPLKYSEISINEPLLKKDTVSFWILPSSSEVLPEVYEKAKVYDKATGEEIDNNLGRDMALDFAMGAAFGLLALPAAIAIDANRNRNQVRKNFTGHENQTLQKAIIVTKNDDGDYVKVCDQLSKLDVKPSRESYSKFTTFKRDKYDDYDKENRLASIVEFKPECLTTEEKRIIVLYTYAKSRHGGYRFSKTTIPEDTKRFIAKDFGIDFIEN
ncbi:MAG: hypothetical protein HRT47_00465 [Candidatus Caenarcaniphilales bacterium]|nr:hypothetical protein [Candidatus Caenarcaniphilales bacterium]